MIVRPSCPAWFEPAFAHLSGNYRQIALRLWHDEPALRQLIQRLEVYLPSRWRPTACPRCDNTRIRRTDQKGRGFQLYSCAACGIFTPTEGTPFYRLSLRIYPRLYGVAVTLWGPWTPFEAWKIAGCADAKQMAHYRRLLQPLLADVDVTPLVSRPAYRLGFTPAQQGIRCLRCGGNELVYAKRFDRDNPCFKCMTCQYGFFLKASRRHLLPLPEGLQCPSCAGKSLIRKKAGCNDGRASYRCRDCNRTFISSPKKRQPSKYGPATAPA